MDSTCPTVRYAYKSFRKKDLKFVLLLLCFTCSPDQGSFSPALSQSAVSYYTKLRSNNQISLFLNRVGQALKIAIEGKESFCRCDT